MSFLKLLGVIERSEDKKLALIYKLIQMKHRVLADLQSCVNLFLDLSIFLAILAGILVLIWTKEYFLKV